MLPDDMTTEDGVPSLPTPIQYDPLASLETDADRIHAEADAFFSAIDVNGDGEISSEELCAHLASVGYAEGAVGHIFALLDVNSDGGISREELRDAFVRYEAPALRLALGLGTAEADAIFDKIDVNKDGQIEKEELSAFMAAGGFPLDSSAADSIFETLDVKGEGSISRAQLREGYVKYSALREALGLSRPPAKSNPKGAPKRWGRGNRKGLSLVQPPSTPSNMLTDSQRRRLQPVHDLERKRNAPRLRLDDGSLREL